MKKLYEISIVIWLIVMVASGTSAQPISPADDSDGENKKTEEKRTPDKKVDERVKLLEAQVAEMRAQLQALQKALGETETKPAEKVASKAPLKREPKSAEASKVTRKRTSKKDLSFDVGDYRVTPYGIIFFNAFANSSGTNNVDDPLWATSNPSGNSGASGRQTRMGVRITGGKIGGANVSGVVEADFYGGFPGVGVGENMGVLRLRVAKAQVDWERTSLIIGQDWMVFAPNNPTSLAAAAIPQFAAAGNPWSRLPQVQVRQKLGKNFLWQGAVLAPGTGDFPTGGATPALLQPGSGSASKVPFFQSRISYSSGNWFGTKKKGTVGFAGHFGRSRVSNGYVADSINSYGAALDWNFPIVKRVTAKGEAFFGENLGGFQAGIFQGYNNDFGPSGYVGENGIMPGIRGIRTQGGWVQIGWNLPAFDDRLTLYGSAGIDDPRDADLMSLSNRNFRTRNFGYAFNGIYKITDQLSVGAEFRRLETSYFRITKQTSNHINVGGKYSF